MFDESIEISDAVVTAIHHKIEDGTVNSRLQISGTLHPALAKKLEAKHLLFNPNGTPKGGFDKLELSTGCGSCRAVFEANSGLQQSLDMTGDCTDHYVVDRQAEGVLALKFRFHYHGDPHTALAYFMCVGQAPSALKVIPLQSSLVKQASADVEEEEEEDERDDTAEEEDDEDSSEREVDPDEDEEEEQQQSVVPPINAYVIDPLPAVVAKESKKASSATKRARAKKKTARKTRAAYYRR